MLSGPALDGLVASIARTRRSGLNLDDRSVKGANQRWSAWAHSCHSTGASGSGS
jgi:hypothetical protein